MKTYAFIVCATILAWISVTHGITGYDCGGRGLNITSLSLLDVAKCDTNSIETSEEEKHIQLLQFADTEPLRIIQCKVEVERKIFRCGMFSHLSTVQGSNQRYITEMTHSACEDLQNTGALVMGTGQDSILRELSRNDTSYRSITLAGKRDTDGWCKGAEFSDNFGTWDEVVVLADVTVVLYDFWGTLQRDTNEVILPSGVRCAAANGRCTDANGVHTFWSVFPTDSCHFDRYETLYEGIATKLTAKGNYTTPTIYTVTEGKTTFALTETRETSMCGRRMVITEHPKLFIIEIEKGQAFPTRPRVTIGNLNIFSYVNSKFLYVEKHMKKTLEDLYRDIMEQKCALETQVLKNALALASIAPDEMAQQIIKEPHHSSRRSPTPYKMRASGMQSTTGRKLLQRTPSYLSKPVILPATKNENTYANGHPEGLPRAPTGYVQNTRHLVQTDAETFGN